MTDLPSIVHEVRLQRAVTPDAPDPAASAVEGVHGSVRAASRR